MVTPATPQTTRDDSPENLYQKGVRNMYENGIEHVPRKYVLPASERPNLVSNSHDDLVDLHLPVIDFSQLQGPNRAQTLQSLAHACENFGFFQVRFSSFSFFGKKKNILV